MRRRRRRKNFFNDLWLSPEAKSGIAIVLLLAIAGVSIFSLLTIGGPFGVYWNQILALLFGRGAWLFPIFLIVIATLRLRDSLERRGAIIFGMTLALLCVLSFIDLLTTPNETEAIVRTAGGGYFGLFLRYVLEQVFGFWAAGLIIISLFVVSLLLTFDIALHALGRFILQVVHTPARYISDFFYGGRPDSDDEEEDGDETEEVTSSRWRPMFHRTTESAIDEVEEDEEDDDEEEEIDEEDEQEEEIDETEEGQQSLPGTQRTVAPRRKYKPIPIDIPLSLLQGTSEKPTGGDLKANKLLIQRTLTNFGITVEMGEINVGPTVTQYTLKPEEGVKLSAITSLQNDLSLALAAHPLRIEAPIPGRSLVGIEVPNRAVATVQLKEILTSDAFQKERRSNLSLAVGKDVSGKGWVADLERMPHLLVAGATGSGKSVCLNGIILSLLYQNNPSDLKFILVDPKRVEFSVYQHMPHLLTPIITEVPATVNALKWLLKEMERRFKVLSEVGARNIQSYNQSSKEKMPFIVLIIDELADLMVAAASEVEGAIIRLTQMSRAVGIHLVLATQRPSVDVITGLIKANVPARIAFSVASLTDSRTILDSSGAEKLLGRGDSLYVSAEVTKPKRLQGAHVGDDEIKAVVQYLKDKAAPDYEEGVTEKQGGSGASGYGGDDDDPLYAEAEQVIIAAGKASASFLQRRLKVGYARAARLLDMLEARGIVGPGDGAKPREVLMTREERDMLATSETEEVLDKEPEIEEEQENEETAEEAEGEDEPEQDDEENNKSF